MTYQEKYTELHNAYVKAGDVLKEALEKIAHVDGFGDTAELASYFKANSAYLVAERSFHTLLKYATSKTLNPQSEYIDSNFMYEAIKDDQQKQGTNWNNNQIRPETGDGGVRGYSCIIGLTNDSYVNPVQQGTEYKFPVVDLQHGRECYKYLASMLQGDDEINVDALDFESRIDGTKQIYVRVEIIIWQ